MKKVITSYYCDRCGAEYFPYGTPEEMTSGYGIVLVSLNQVEIEKAMFGSRSGMALCKECMDSLYEFLETK